MDVQPPNHMRSISLRGGRPAPSGPSPTPYRPNGGGGIVRQHSSLGTDRRRRRSSWVGDALRGLFSRRDAPVGPFVLLPGEAEVARAVGTWRAGAMASIDGHLILTTERLVFASDPDGATTAVLVRAVNGSNPSRAPSTTSIGDLAAVEVGAEASLIGPPSLVLVDSTGGRIEIGTLANRLTPNLSGANPVARDRMVATVRSAITAAAPARPEHRRPTAPDRFSWFTNDS